ncbi:MAG: hypothetical protein JSU98_03890 [Gemmatimonadales bacterium]|jgi:hypothetical protein|nr:MAG: hypothetical protein JSU98_03890 [Gemmatimonadales bacterium]
MTEKRRTVWVAGMLAALLVGTACEEENLAVPSAEEAAAYYSAVTDLSVEIVGNVAEVTVEQPAAQLQRGGSLWARVGPYIYLFSDSTQRLFQDYPGLAAVRVITTTPGGREVARATLLRTTLNDLTWRRALNIAGLARRDGTEQVTLLEDLVQWGEDRTEYEYNPRYVRR